MSREKYIERHKQNDRLRNIPGKQIEKNTRRKLLREIYIER